MSFQGDSCLNSVPVVVVQTQCITLGIDMAVLELSNLAFPEKYNSGLFCLPSRVLDKKKKKDNNKNGTWITYKN